MQYYELLEVIAEEVNGNQGNFNKLWAHCASRTALEKKIDKSVVTLSMAASLTVVYCQIKLYQYLEASMNT